MQNLAASLEPEMVRTLSHLRTSFANIVTYAPLYKECKWYTLKKSSGCYVHYSSYIVPKLSSPECCDGRQSPDFGECPASRHPRRGDPARPGRCSRFRHLQKERNRPARRRGRRRSLRCCLGAPSGVLGVE